MRSLQPITAMTAIFLLAACGGPTSSFSAHVRPSSETPPPAQVERGGPKEKAPIVEEEPEDEEEPYPGEEEPYDPN